MCNIHTYNFFLAIIIIIKIYKNSLKKKICNLAPSIIKKLN